MATLAFLQALFQGCAEGYITLSAIHPTRARASPSRHLPVARLDALTKAVECLLQANTQGWGAFVGIALRQHPLGRWRRGGQSDLLALPALFADLDTPQAYERLNTVHLPPSCVVRSGKGWHVYWFIQPTQAWDLAERTLKGLGRWLEADKTSLSQSLRLVGSHNYKLARPPTYCELRELHPQRRYTLADFSPYALAPRLPPLTHQLTEKRPLIPQIIAILQATYGGYLKANGWWAARCPLGHRHDYSGSHFNFQPQGGYAYCFGKHQHIPLATLCSILNLAQG